MKNKLIILLSLLFNTVLFAENIFIESKNISIDKNKELSIFKNEVFIRTEENNTIKSEYAEYDKTKGFIKVEKNVIAKDKQNNIIETQYAEYDEIKKIFKSIGPTKVITTEKYIIEGTNIVFDNNKNHISSNEKTIITDQDNNKIYLDNFSYLTKNNIFKSIGFIQIEDVNNNKYEFSQIYIDTKKKEILGTDSKSYMNDNSLKFNEDNKPRIFANSVKINNEKSLFNKSVFTLCGYRENDKCPPWSIQASKMLHDNKKKTIFYNNAVIKIYDIPVFYIPRLSHPDPSVDRRSGFLPPTLSSSKNLGSGLTVPYFWAVNDDKNLTFTNKLYSTEHPLVLGEYHQAFKNSNLLTDFGYTKGFKNENLKKKLGDKSHFFTKYVRNFNTKNNSENSLNITAQNVSNDKYLKLYKIESNLVDYNTSTLENSIDFTQESNDIFFGFNTSVYETLKDSYVDKYEYIYPEITLNKNLLNSGKIGSIDLQTNYKTHKYDTNKLSNFFVNDFDWKFRDINFKSGLKGKILGNVRNINYETKNIDLYKNDTTSEAYGALGYLSELNLQKNNKGANHLLKPKLLLRYSPGSMRQETSGSRLNPINAFNLKRLDNINNYETGLTSTVGFDYKIKKQNNEFDFSVAQIINEKENKKMASKTSLDEKLSDLVGSASYDVNQKVSLNYNFAIDQNYNDFNYNEVGTTLNFNPIKIDFNYLQENEHIGNQEYFKTKIDVAKNKDGILSFETKRNLVTNSAEFYNLSYEYLNDCLRAGLVYRREFYNDSEIEPENSLMFKITLTPFGNINSPSFNQ